MYKQKKRPFDIQQKKSFYLLFLKEVCFTRKTMSSDSPQSWFYHKLATSSQ